MTRSTIPGARSAPGWHRAAGDKPPPYSGTGSSLPGNASRTPVERPQSSFVALSVAAVAALAVGSWYFVLFGDQGRAAELLSPDTWHRVAEFLGELVGAGDSETPAFLRPERWGAAAGLAYETLAMSVLAVGIAAVGALLTVMLAARSVARGALAPSGSPLWPLLFFVVRGLYVFTRAVPELVWAMLIIFVLSPGILPGAVALGLHNFGILGKLGAEVVEDLDPRPARALRACGAGGAQILLFAILPTVLPQFLTYLLYRWEVIIRTTIVVGFVSAGGLGREFRLNMSWLHYTDVMLLLMLYLLLVLSVDLIAAGLRRLSR